MIRKRLAEELAKAHQDLMQRNVELELLNKEKTLWLWATTLPLAPTIPGIVWQLPHPKR
jgi:hypothetical protein